MAGISSKRSKGGRPPGSRSTDPLIAAAFGRAVAALRIERGLSQDGLALEADVDRSYLGRLERGEYVPNLVGVVKLSRALGCTAAYLVSAFEEQLRASRNEAIEEGPLPAP